MRGKDQFWEHVVVENGRSRCIYCRKDFAPDNINRIKKHLARVAGHGIVECAYVPENVRDEARKSIGDLINPRKKGKTTNASYSTDGRNIFPSSDVVSGAFQDNHLPAADTSVMQLKEMDHNREVNKKFFKFLILNNIEPAVVDSPSFIDFISAIKGDHYKLLSSSELQMESVPEIEKEVEGYVEGVKNSWNSTGCTLMLEKICDSTNFIIYSHKGAIFVGAFRADSDIEGVVGDKIEEIGVENVVQFITNSPEILESVGNMFKAKYTRIYTIGCVAQEIHSLLKEICQKVDWIRHVIDHAELITKYLYGDATILSSMRKQTNGRELKLPCESKYASNYQMLRSIFTNKDELQQLVSSQEWNSNSNEVAREVTFIIQSANFWCQVQEAINAMEPIVKVLRLVEEDKPTSGYLYGAMIKAREEILRQRKYEMVLEIFDKKKSNIMHPVHAAAAFLNPAYFSHDDLWDKEMIKGVDFLLENLVISGEEKDRFVTEMAIYRRRPPDVFNTTSGHIIRLHHPCEWWDHVGPHFPVLKKYAIRILSQSCKCSISNIRPTAFEVAQQKKMGSSRKATPNLQDLTIMNTIMMSRFTTIKEQLTSRIDLEQYQELPDCFDPKMDLADANFDDGSNKNGANMQTYVQNRPEDVGPTGNDNFSSDCGVVGHFQYPGTHVFALGDSNYANGQHQASTTMKEMEEVDNFLDFSSFIHE